MALPPARRPGGGPAPAPRVFNRMTAYKPSNIQRAAVPAAVQAAFKARPMAYNRMQSVSKTIAQNTPVRTTKAAAPVAAVPYVRKRPETPPMGGLQDSSTAQQVAQEQVAQEQVQEQMQQEQGYYESGGGGGGGGGAAPQGSTDDQAQRDYEAQLAAYNEQMAQQGIRGGGASQALAVKAAEKPGIFRRFYNWLFGKKTTISGEPTDSVIMREAAHLVLRARKGDQNAMDTIYMVRQSALKGSPRAIRAYAALKEYVYANPVGSNASSYAPGDIKYERRSALANAPLLTNDRIRSVESAFGSEQEQRAFHHGVNHHRHEKKIEKLAAKLPPKAAQALLAGTDVGNARAIQKLRHPKSRVSEFNPIIGWELGEK